MKMTIVPIVGVPGMIAKKLKELEIKERIVNIQKTTLMKKARELMLEKICDLQYKLSVAIDVKTMTVE